MDRKHLHSRLIVAGLLGGWLGSGCTVGGELFQDAGLPPGVDGGARSCAADEDDDGDGIANDLETDDDRDDDGTPNHLDTDSDGDGFSDLDEHGAVSACGAVDSDLDGLPDFLDTDSDSDGLSDAAEREAGTNPRVVDSDGDGFSDLIEVEGSHTDPNDALDQVPAEDFAIVLPFEGEPVHRSLSFSTDLRVADVYFLIDTTASMNAAIENVRASLSRIATEVDTRIPDVQLGVGRFDDFPFGTRATTGFCGTGDYGCEGDLPYAHVRDVTDQLPEVQAALDGLFTRNGGDGPESQAEALRQIATGAGGVFRYDGLPDVVIAPRVCPSIPDETSPRFGYACFRPRALPIVVMVSDAVWHGDDLDAFPYVGIAPAPATFDDAAMALAAIRARFIGVSVTHMGVGGGGALRTPAELATHTGTVDGRGRPLVYEADEGEVSDAIVFGIQQLAQAVPQDVTSRLENVPGNPDGYDATRFIAGVTPVEAYAHDGTPGPRGGATYTSRDGASFYDVVPGATVEFDVLFRNDERPPEDSAQIFRAKIFVVGNDVTDLDMREVYVVVPSIGCGDTCLLI